MKKLLALVLVLGMASMANAALTLSVSRDGGQTYEPAVSSEITLLVSETIWIGIGNDASVPGGWVAAPGIPAPGNVPNELGEWTGNHLIYSPPGLTTASATWVADYYGTIYYDLDYWSLNNSVPSTVPSEPGVVFGLEFHCKGVGDVDIVLPSDPFGNPEAILTIHQIPEPMTMALLGLGGLALIRRRR
jgi:hypothetical protein